MIEAAASAAAAVRAAPDSGADDAPARADGGDASGLRTYYQFLDDRGSVRFVASLDEVPPEWRDRAGRVEMASAPPARPADRRAAQAATRERAREAVASRVAARAGGDVVLYYADWCGYCRKAKAHLDGKGVAYELRDVDIAAVKSELVAKTGSGGIPVLDVGGQYVRGFDPGAIDRLLASR
ncbi:MAG: glutaredoxin family protein [Myxococcota bacterium]